MMRCRFLRCLVWPLLLVNRGTVARRPLSRGRGRLKVVLLVIAALIGANWSFAEAVSLAQPSAETPRLHSYGAIWNVADELREVPHWLSTEVTIAYYDVAWKIGWLCTDGARAVAVRIDCRYEDVRSQSSRDSINVCDPAARVLGGIVAKLLRS